MNEKFLGIKELDKTNPGLSDHMWDYATSESRKKENSLYWYDNFIGGIVIEANQYNFGYSISNEKTNENGEKAYFPIYVGYYDDRNLEEEEVDFNEKPYVLMVYGNDDASYFLRCKNKEEINLRIKKLKDSKDIWDFLESYEYYYYN